jgi:hypothetical protein
VQEQKSNFQTSVPEEIDNVRLANISSQEITSDLFLPVAKMQSTPAVFANFRQRFARVSLLRILIKETGFLHGIQPGD